MLDDREYRGFIDFRSVFVLVILMFGFIIFSNSSENKSVISHIPLSTGISIGENNAFTSQFIALQVFQKIWIVNRDNFNLLGFNRNILSENKITSIRISYLKQLRLGSPKILHFLLHYHFFPPETDEPHLLS